MIGRRKILEAVPAPIVQAVAEPAVLSPAERAARTEAGLLEARADLKVAEGELATSQSDYGRAADAADIGSALAARARTTAAEVAVDVACRAVERLHADLSAQLDGLADAAELADRDGLRAAAEAAAVAYEAAFREYMPAITAQSRELVRLWAEAELAREAAAAKGVALPRPDAFRDDTGVPRVEVRHRELDLWVNPYGAGAPYGEEIQQRIKQRADGFGVLVSANHTTIVERKRRFTETTFRPAAPARLAPLLAEQLAVPALMAGDAAGWVKPEDSRRSFSPRLVLDALDALEMPRRAPAEPELRTERKPTEPARDVLVRGDVPRVSVSRSI